VPTYSAKVVRRPRQPRKCAQCRNLLLREHLVLFGCAFEGDQPYQIRLCCDCASQASEKVVQAALAKALS